MTTPLPSYIKTGRVLGPQLVVSVDTATDVDKQPDAAFPVGSTLVFTPGVSSLSYTDGAAHAVAYLKPVTAVIGSDGNPETPSGDELWLPATENQGLANDQQWTWRVTPQIVGMTGIPSFAFRVTSGVDNYLSDQQPIPAASASSAVARGRDGAGAPPAGTPDHYMAVAVGESTVWMSPAAAAALLESTLNGVYAALLSTAGGYTYNADGTVASDPDGATYAYNADGTLHTETLRGVTRTYAYNADGTLASVA